MCKVKILLIASFIANHFNHATTENYEEQFPDEKEKESIDNFIAVETNSFLAKLNEKRVEDTKDQITMKQIQDDTQVTQGNEILIDILNNFSTTLKDQNENREEKIEYIEIKDEKYCYKITIEAKNGIMFTSDTHAEADKVEKIWYFFDKLKKENEVDKLVFLGDYGDRGKFWTYTYFLLAAMAEKYGEDIIFIRGNHEERRTMYENGGMRAYYAMDKNQKCAEKCWNEMPLICDITWHQKKIFCSHGAIPLNEQGKWEKRGKDKDQWEFFLANWNENIFTEDLKQKIQPSSRKIGYAISIKEIFQNMVNNEYDWSIHGHVHKNQCGILTTEKLAKRVVTVVANEGYYNFGNIPFLPAVYIINDKNLNGTFFNLLQKQNEKIQELDKEKQKNRKVLNNCVIYEYDFELQKTKKETNEINKENPTNEEGKNKDVIYKENKNKEKKIGHNILKKICCCCDICEK